MLRSFFSLASLALHLSKFKWFGTRIYPGLTFNCALMTHIVNYEMKWDKKTGPTKL